MQWYSDLLFWSKQLRYFLIAMIFESTFPTKITQIYYGCNVRSTFSTKTTHIYFGCNDIWIYYSNQINIDLFWLQWYSNLFFQPKKFILILVAMIFGSTFWPKQLRFILVAMIFRSTIPTKTNQIDFDCNDIQIHFFDQNNSDLF